MCPLKLNIPEKSQAFCSQSVKKARIEPALFLAKKFFLFFKTTASGVHTCTIEPSEACTALLSLSGPNTSHKKCEGRDGVETQKPATQQQYMYSSGFV